MLFSDEGLFESARAALASALSTLKPEKPNPLPCDRWIARSALQKAIRRGDGDLASRSTATLLLEDPRNVWRHLAIICLEDVGAANVELLAQIVAARPDRRWRDSMGGDWAVTSGLVRLMAASEHCQAACDLLLRIENDAQLRLRKSAIVELDVGELVSLVAEASSLIERGMAALALAGCLSANQSVCDPHAVFDVLSRPANFGSLTEACRSAWKITRNPMALLMPLTWESSLRCMPTLKNDNIVPVAKLGDIPGYALDRFTRAGNSANRKFLAGDATLVRLLGAAGIHGAERTKMLGDVIFLIEGGLAARRLTWPEAEKLRNPARWLPAVATLGPHLPKITAYCEAQASQITIARARTYTP